MKIPASKMHSLFSQLWDSINSDEVIEITKHNRTVGYFIKPRDEKDLREVYIQLERLLIKRKSLTEINKECLEFSEITES